MKSFRNGHFGSLLFAAGSIILTSQCRTQGQDVLPNIPMGTIAVNLTPLVTGLSAPDYAISAPGQSNRLYVLEQKGTVLIIQNGTLLPSPALDIGSVISLGATAGVNSYNPANANDERGLLGIAFHPGFSNPVSPGYKTLYTYNSQPLGTGATYAAPNGATQNFKNAVNEWKWSASDPDKIDPASRREVISFGKNANNHNGGTIAFGPDGYLYLGLGDGGNSNDVGASHIEPGGNAQNLSTPLGKMLRIDPLNPTLTTSSSDPVSTNGQYRIPATNPFQSAGQAPEIYAYGFRNPYRFAFDRLNGELIVADVGQRTIEEIDRVTLGGNFGWALKEGDFLFNRSTGDVGVRSPGSPAGLIDPITGPSATLEYDHGDGISITGGFVYRGSLIPALYGKYVFGDLALRTSPSRADGRLFYADLATGQIFEFRLPQFSTTYLPNGLTVHGFGEDANGELYALATNTASSGTGGIIYAITPLTDLESWRLLHFNTTANTGNAANSFDYDQDGLVNMVEYAFGLNPKQASSLALPQPQFESGGFGVTFSEPAGVSGVIYQAQWSADLEPGSWAFIPDTGNGTIHTFNLPVASTPRVFIRYRLTIP